MLSKTRPSSSPAYLLVASGLSLCRADGENIAEFAKGVVVAERLWGVSEELVDERFEF